MKKLFFIAILLIGISSCNCNKSTGKSESPSNNETKEENTKKSNNLVINPDYNIKAFKQNYNLVSANIKRNEISFIVSYSGGCKPHDFQLITNNNTLKSYPPKKHIWLEHNTNGDACRQLITDTITYSIKELQIEGQKSISLILNNSTDVSYTY